jgi:hypothetical protein
MSAIKQTDDRAAGDHHAAGILRAGTKSYPRQRHVHSQAGEKRRFDSGL